MNLDENRLSDKEKWIRTMNHRNMELARIEKEKEEQDDLQYKSSQEYRDRQREMEQAPRPVYESSSEDECIHRGKICATVTSSYQNWINSKHLPKPSCVMSSSDDESIPKPNDPIPNPSCVMSSSDDEPIPKQNKPVLNPSTNGVIMLPGVELVCSSEDEYYGPRNAPVFMRESSKKLLLHHTCPYKPCKFRSRTKNGLMDHVNRHEGIKPFVCPLGWCEYSTTTKNNLKIHMKQHTRQGFIKKLREEYRVIRKLREWGLNVDTEITIDASRNGCVPDTDRKYSRVDMVVLNVTSCILILEVDEFAHEKPTYNIPCELSRMADINAFLRLNSYTKPIFWLRYNPNGKYFIGEKEKKVSREKRESALKQKIFSMMEPDFVPTGNENIHYMFYPRVSESGPPKILENSQYPEYVKNIVSWGGIV